MSDADERPQAAIINWLTESKRPQEYYEAIKEKFAEERDLRLKYRPEGTSQYTSDLDGEFARYEIDPYGGEITPREPINDTVECLFIGGGFSALLTSARLREYGVESIRIVERGADVGGTWYWNRYPGAACDVVAYDYLPLLDETGYVPLRAWAGYYEHNTLDQNGIVGRHPALDNLIVANGFSGHGIQQSPAVGRAVAELIVHGAYRSLDLTPLGVARILANAPLRELNVV